MLKKALLSLMTVLCSQIFLGAQEPVISIFKDNYMIGGIPLDSHIDNKSIDIKFQASVMIRPFRISDKMQAFFAYTQVSTWNAFCESQPFHDNSYKPGIYLEVEQSDKNTFLYGLEHFSNGRPYFGNQIATQDYDDLSRGMNYAFATWIRQQANSTFYLKLKAGVGCGVKDYDAHMHHLFSQELFYKYVGYLTLGYRFSVENFDAFASVTPLYNKSLANITTELSYKFSDRAPKLFAQFHYGYDEALCDCLEGKLPPINLRIGLMLSPGKRSRRLSGDL